MAKLNWLNLRVWAGSQQTAFEELCCQLASYEDAPPAAKFTRKGIPDAGVECYWTLPSGEEWGWQTKFFLSNPEEGQWRQLDDSVKTALIKHPNLTRYTVCLPLDRSDSRDGGKKSFLDKWNDRVMKWEKWASERGMRVDFPYWGEHELFERLSREQHRGRLLFWFRQELFSTDWFRDRLDEAIANAGARYTPKLNVELPISRIFDGLGRTQRFADRFRKSRGEIRRRIVRAVERSPDDLAESHRTTLANSAEKLLEALDEAHFEVVGPIDFARISSLAVEVSNNAWDYGRLLSELAEKQKQQSAGKERDRTGISLSEKIAFRRNDLSDLAHNLDEIAEFCESIEAQLANVPALALRGDAGTGKTHLFCDIASERVNEGFPVLLLLGGHFNLDEPWSQILGLLGLDCSKEAFLGSLQAVAEAHQSRVLLMIDALNEGEGKLLWHKHLAGMLTLIRKFSRVGFAVSVRSSYEDVVVPKDLPRDRIVRATHHGFSERSYEAARIFFSAYGIKQPSVPLLSPEFENPLFLKLFCDGLKNQGMTEVPKGLHGVTKTFDSLIDSINDKLASPEYLDYDPREHPVRASILSLAERLATAATRWLPRDEARELINTFLPATGYEKSLFRHLLAEGLLSEDRFHSAGGGRAEGIRLTYDRLTDHLIVACYLDRYLDRSDPKLAFAGTNPLADVVRDETSCRLNQGLVEALCVQLPERAGVEVPQVSPHVKSSSAVREAFVKSLVWRTPSSIGKETLEYINDSVIRHRFTHEEFLDALITLAAVPEHPLNAAFLHRNLLKQKMPVRDSTWSVFLHEQYGRGGAVDRLLDWSLLADDKTHIDDESLRLAGTALVWFLAASNRSLRDRATKGLIFLLAPRVGLLHPLLESFSTVDDPYVAERLYAVAYGCALRSRDARAVCEVGKLVFRLVFEGGRPLPHILLRDYARGVVEVALRLDPDSEIQREAITPPYKSRWPSRIPSEQELKRKYGIPPEQGGNDLEWSRMSIYHSVMDSGDFARYVIGTNFGNSKWSKDRLRKPRTPSRRESFEAFVAGLTSRQCDRWNRYETAFRNVQLYESLEVGRRTEIFGTTVPKAELRRAITEAEGSLRSVLGKSKIHLLQRYVLPYLKNPHLDDVGFDLRTAQRWICQRVFDLGWTVERFGSFDRSMDLRNSGREAAKAERIGKKYQWIAWHEFLARVSDHFRFRGDQWARNEPPEVVYEGPWQVGARDIDPSCLLTRKPLGDPAAAWWLPCRYSDWERENELDRWLKKQDDLPPMEGFLQVVSRDGTQWFALEGFVKWDEPVPPEENRYDVPRRQLWYMIRSYIVRRADLTSLYQWARRQDFMGRWMPEAPHSYDIFLGEFFWAPAFRSQDCDYHGRVGWTRGSSGKIPREVLVSADGYLQEGSGFDRSVEDSFMLQLPCKWLVDNAKLRWSGVEGCYVSEDGKLCAFDPSATAAGPDGLLVSRETLLEVLSEQDCAILWTVLGQKLVLGGGLAQTKRPYGRLDISGAFRLQNGEVAGKVTSRLVGS